MEKQYRVTVGISAFNEEKNITQLLKAILWQKSKRFIIERIFVFSDGSNDDTVKSARKVTDTRIQVIDTKQRRGQTVRQNEIIDMMPKTSDFLLFFEADTLPNQNYIAELIELVPENMQFSLIVGDSIPVNPTHFFEKAIVAGYWLKKEIFEHAKDAINLYLCGHNGLLSKAFLKNFRWNPGFHEDSYLYRKAKSSKLPLIRAKRAKLYYKSVNNLTDYILQSSKYRKAKEKEERHSRIYQVNIEKKVIAKLFITHFLRHPLLLSTYLASQLIAKIYSIFAPQYSPFWKIYSSSKTIVLS